MENGAGNENTKELLPWINVFPCPRMESVVGSSLPVNREVVSRVTLVRLPPSQNTTRRTMTWLVVDVFVTPHETVSGKEVLCVGTACVMVQVGGGLFVADKVDERYRLAPV